MLETIECENGVRAWATDRGRLAVRRPADWVLVFEEHGYLGSAFIDRIEAEQEAALERASRIYVFVDCFELEGYEPDLRLRLTEWLMKNRSRVIAQHMLVRSRFVRMGLAVASLALGGLIEGHSSRESFEQALQHAVSLAPDRGSTRNS